MKRIIKHYRLALLGAAVGALGGYLYWYFVGCNSGSCPITASPINSSLWGAVMGALLFDLFRKEKKNDTHSDCCDNHTEKHTEN